MKFLLLFALMSAAFAEGPDKVGNGEIVVKCGDKVRLAEFHEAETLDGMKSKPKMIDSKDDVELQVLNALNKLENAKENFKLYQTIKKNVNWVSGSNYHWNFTNDLGPFPMVDGCDVENIINYYEDDFIEGNTKLYDALTNSEKAALWVHEVLYKRARRLDKNLKTSLGIRRIVTLLFSDSTDIDLLEGLEFKHLKAKGYNHVIAENSGADVKFSIDYTWSKLSIMQKGRNINVTKSGDSSFTVTKAVPGKTYWFYVSWTNKSTDKETVYLHVNGKFASIQTVMPLSAAGVFLYILPQSVREFEKGRM